MDRRIKVDAQPDPGLVVDEEILGFEGVPASARGPETVCHRIITGDPAYYPQAEFHGRTIYFCTETCQSVFLSDPERFYTAHSKRRP